PGPVPGRPDPRRQPAARRDPELDAGQGPLPAARVRAAGGTVRLHERAAQLHERHGVVQHGAQPLRPGQGGAGRPAGGQLSRSATVQRNGRGISPSRFFSTGPVSAARSWASLDGPAATGRPPGTPTGVYRGRSMTFTPSLGRRVNVGSGTTSWPGTS